MLRTFRYGEADRILHLYTPHAGRVGAIAKGVRRTRSRFGGRLEPFFRLSIELYEGRGELFTVTGASTIDAHPRLREHAGAIDAAARACDAVGRLFETADPHPHVFNLLCRHLRLLNEQPVEAGRARSLAFRMKLLHAAGFAPALAACAHCGDARHLSGFSAAAGGVVCRTCEAGSFPIGAEAHRFMADALASPLLRAPSASGAALGEVERAIAEMLAHHAQVRLIPAAAAGTIER